MKLIILKILVGIGGLTLVMLGLRGIWMGARIATLEKINDLVGDSHIRYFATFTAGIGVLMWSRIPTIATPSTIFATICSLIFIGGCIRIASAIGLKPLKGEVLAVAASELFLPVLTLWLQASLNT